MSENKVKWHKYPDEKPAKNGRYLVTRIKTSMEGGRKEVITHYYAGEFHDEDWTKTIAWAELPEPYGECYNEVIYE